jgi:hypothetical protein
MMLHVSIKMPKPTLDLQPSDTEIAYLEQVLREGYVQRNIAQTSRYVGQTGGLLKKR